MVCRQCGWDNEAGAAFCSGCGAPMAPGSEAAVPQAGRAPKPRRSGGRGLMLLLALILVLGVGGTLLGVLVIYPAREAAKVTAAYERIEQAANSEDLEALAACTSGPAKSDVDAIANGLRVFQALVPVTVDLTATIEVGRVTVHGSTAEAEVTLNASWSAAVAGRQLGGTSDGISETHTWKRTAGEWKLDDWGENGFISGLAAKLPRL